MNRNIYQILAELEELEPGALRKNDANGIRVMVRNKIVIKQEGQVILHRVNTDGMFDVYCFNCGEYITTTYEDFIRKYPERWEERKLGIYVQHKSLCKPRPFQAQGEVASTKE